MKKSTAGIRRRRRSRRPRMIRATSQGIGWPVNVRPDLAESPCLGAVLAASFRGAA